MLRRGVVHHHQKVTSLPYSSSAFPLKSTKHNEPSNLSSVMELNRFMNLLRDRCKSGTVSFDEAKGFFNRLIQTKPIPSVVYFNQILGAIVKNRHYSSVFSLFRLMDSIGIESDIATFTILIDCYCCLGRVDFGFGVLGSILKRGFEPNSFTLNTLLKGIFLNDKVEKGTDFFNKIVDNGYPCDEFTYGVTIDKLCKIGNISAALRLMKATNKRKVRLNVQICNMVIDNLCKNNQLNEALNIFQQMIGGYDFSYDDLGTRKVGTGFLGELAISGITPDVVTFSILMDGLCKHERVKEALNLLDVMSQRGEKPDVITYNSLIHGLCISGQLRKAITLFEEMVNCGISPNVRTYTILLDAICEEGVIKKAHRLLYVMIQRGEEPKTWTYNALMQGYCVEGQMKAAFKVFLSMLDKGNKPSIVSYNILINGYCKSNQIDEAVLLFGDMCHKGLEPDTITYNILIGGLCKVGRVSAAQEIFKEMRTYGKNQDIFTYGVLIDGLCTNNCFSEAVELYHMMENNGLKANIVIYNVIIANMCKAGQLNEARKMFCSLPGEGLQPDTNLYTTMINAFCKQGMLKEAADLFLEMDKKGSFPNEVTFNIMVRGFLQANDTKNAVELIKVMVEREFSLDQECIDLLGADEPDQECSDFVRKLISDRLWERQRKDQSEFGMAATSYDG